MRLFVLLIALWLLTTPAFAQQGANVPIMQMQNGGLIQPDDAIHIARCSFFGCDYQVTLGAMAQLATLGANGTCARTDGTTTFWGPCGTGSGIVTLTGDVTASGAGTVAASIAAIQGTTVTGTTGSGSVVFSASPALSGTISAVNLNLGGALLVTGSVTINSLADGCAQIASHVLTSTGSPCGSGGGGGGSGTVTSFSFSNANGVNGSVATSTTTPALTLSPTAGGTFASSSNNLGFFASTTSAQLISIISDETGTGALVFAGSPTFTGTLNAAAVTASGTVTLSSITGSTQCLHVNSSGAISGTGSDCGSASGGVTTTGSPATGNLTKFSGTNTITNGDLSGDVTTSGALAATVVKVNGVSYGTSPSTNTVPVVTGTNAITYEVVPNAALANSAITFGSTSQALGSTVTNLNAVNIGPGTAGTGAFTTLSSSSLATSGLGSFATVDIGSTAAAQTGSILDMSHANTSLILPTGTNAQRPTGIAGMVRYNSSIPGLEAFYSTVWNALGTGTVTTTGTPTTNNIVCFSGSTSIANCSDQNFAFLDVAQTWTAPQRAPQQTPAISTATFTPNFNTGADFTIGLTSACPCTLANPGTTPVAGQKGIIYVVQDATGSRTITTWGSDYFIAGGTTAITLSTAANAIDSFSYTVKDSTHIILSTPSLNATH